MHTSFIYLERLSFYAYMKPEFISKCITLMTSKRQDIPIYRTFEYGRNLTFMDLVSDRTLVKIV